MPATMRPLTSQTLDALIERLSSTPWPTNGKRKPKPQSGHRASTAKGRAGTANCDLDNGRSTICRRFAAKHASRSTVQHLFAERLEQTRG